MPCIEPVRSSGTPAGMLPAALSAGPASAPAAASAAQVHAPVAVAGSVRCAALALALTGLLAAGCAQRGALPAPEATISMAATAAPGTARNWDEFQVLAARRLVAANPGRTYMGEVPEPLLAIPVLEVELGPDGSVRGIKVVRHPKQALDTVQLAIDAIQRAAPYGDVSRLPRPWRFTEVFLFDDERRFKPRTLDR